jgi:hypothetical protein
VAALTGGSREAQVAEWFWRAEIRTLARSSHHESQRRKLCGRSFMPKQALPLGRGAAIAVGGVRSAAVLPLYLPALHGPARQAETVGRFRKSHRRSETGDGEAGFTRATRDRLGACLTNDRRREGATHASHGRADFGDRFARIAVLCKRKDRQKMPLWGCDACVARVAMDGHPGLARSRDCAAQCRSRRIISQTGS